MEMTAEDRIFLGTRNFAEVREEGRKEGREEGRKEGREEGRGEGIEIGMGTTLLIMRDLCENKSIEEIAAQYPLRIEKIKQIQEAMTPRTA